MANDIDDIDQIIQYAVDRYFEDNEDAKDYLKWYREGDQKIPSWILGCIRVDYLQEFGTTTDYDFDLQLDAVRKALDNRQ